MKFKNKYIMLAFYFTCAFIFLETMKCFTHHHTFLLWICFIPFFGYAIKLILATTFSIKRTPAKWTFYIRRSFRKWVSFLGLLTMGIFWGHEIVERLPMSQQETLTITKADLEEIIAANESAFIEQDELLQQGLLEENYAAATDAERLETLALIAKYEAEHLGIAMPVLQAAPLAENIGGYFNHDENIIYVNSHFLDHYNCSIETVVHEMYHAYQYACIQKIDLEGDLLFLRTVETWRQEYEEIYNDLQSDEGLTAYYTQDSEESARKYAEERCELYFQYQ